MVHADDSDAELRPYQGIYRINFTDSGKLVNTPYKDVNNILSSGHNHLFRIGNKMLLLTRKGTFEYDGKIKDFKISAFFSNLFPGSYISYLREDADGNIWFIQDKKPGVINMKVPSKPVITYFPELNNHVLGNDDEFIYPINKNNILISGEIGLYHIDYEKYANTRHQLQVLLRGVTAFHQRDSTLFGGYQVSRDAENSDQVYTLQQKLSYRWNSVHFDFSAPFYGGTVEYSCRLKDYEEEFSPWSRRTERSYTNLPPGDYVFEPLLEIDPRRPGLLACDIALDTKRIAYTAHADEDALPIAFSNERDGASFEFRLFAVADEPVPDFRFYGGRLTKRGAASALHQSEYLILLVDLIALRAQQTGLFREVAV